MTSKSDTTARGAGGRYRIAKKGGERKLVSRTKPAENKRPEWKEKAREQAATDKPTK